MIFIQLLLNVGKTIRKEAWTTATASITGTVPEKLVDEGLHRFTNRVEVDLMKRLNAPSSSSSLSEARCCFKA